jgi:FtsH-binding integral membrane protein
MSDYAAPLPASALDIPRVAIRPLLRNVYLWMTAGLSLTAVVAYLCANTQALLNLWDSPWIAFGALIGQLILVVVLSTQIMRLSPPAATLIFLAYAALTGFSLTGIVLYYDAGTLTIAFATTAALFGVMTIIGAFTKLDLTKVGTYLIIGLIGLLIAMLINIFISSDTFDIVISIIGVVIFTGLTAADTQKIVRMSSDPLLEGDGGVLLARLSIIGALMLYLDFLNLFLFLLRIFGRRQ